VVAVGSVAATDVVSTFSGRGPSSCNAGIYPTLSAYGEAIAIAGPSGAAIVSGTSFAAPQVTGAVALLSAMYPGATPDAIIDALVRGARDVGAPGPDQDTGAGILNVAQSAALLAGADHSGPRVDMSAQWSKDAAHPGLVLSGRAQERGGGTSDGITASAFISPDGVPGTPIPLTATPSDASSAQLAGAVTRRQVRLLIDGRHALYARARDASGNWGPARQVVLPIDRAAPTVHASGARHGDVIPTVLRIRERGSGLVTLRYRLEIAGRPGRWHAVAPGAVVKVVLHARRGSRAVLRVKAADLVGNETKAGFVLPG
jgi:hypothetical protein